MSRRARLRVQISTLEPLVLMSGSSCDGDEPIVGNEEIEIAESDLESLESELEIQNQLLNNGANDSTEQDLLAPSIPTGGVADPAAQSGLAAADSGDEVLEILSASTADALDFHLKCAVVSPRRVGNSLLLMIRHLIISTDLSGLSGEWPRRSAMSALLAA